MMPLRIDISYHELTAWTGAERDLQPRLLEGVGEFEPLVRRPEAQRRACVHVEHRVVAPGQLERRARGTGPVAGPIDLVSVLPREESEHVREHDRFRRKWNQLVDEAVLPSGSVPRERNDPRRAESVREDRVPVV